MSYSTFFLSFKILLLLLLIIIDGLKRKIPSMRQEYLSAEVNYADNSTQTAGPHHERNGEVPPPSSRSF